MFGDYVTKPLQGAVFSKRFRDYIMGLVPIEDPDMQCEMMQAKSIENKYSSQTRKEQE